MKAALATPAAAASRKTKALDSPQICVQVPDFDIVIDAEQQIWGSGELWWFLHTWIEDWIQEALTPVWKIEKS